MQSGQHPFPLHAVAPLTEKDDYVRGCTALLDAIGYGVEKMVNIQRHLPEDDRFGIGADRAVRFENDAQGVAVNYHVVSETVCRMRQADCPASVGAAQAQAVFEKLKILPAERQNTRLRIVCKAQYLGGCCFVVVYSRRQNGSKHSSCSLPSSRY